MTAEMWKDAFEAEGLTTKIYLTNRQTTMHLQLRLSNNVEAKSHI